MTTRQYMGHVIGSHTPVDALGQDAKADCTDKQLDQYLQETSAVADKIVETLNKPESP